MIRTRNRTSRDKNKEQLDQIECRKKKLEITGKHRKIIVYLKKVINKLFEKYLDSSTNDGRNVLLNSAKNKQKIDYNNLKYKLVVGN